MTQEQRKQAFKSLGEYLLNPDKQLEQLINSAQLDNAWFTPTEVEKAITAWGQQLNLNNLNNWLTNSVAKDGFTPKMVGLVLAGNIPLVGFHDILSVLASGHIAMIKTSSQDKKLIPHVLNKLLEFEPLFQNQIIYTERLENFDAVIATGSNNSSRYFEYYFSKVPHIIRKNRSSVAILTGEETFRQLHNLGKDIFDFYGLGCRNVSKLFVPTGYNFNNFFEAIEEYKNVANHHKYCNNYDYNKSIYLLNNDKHLDNGFLLVKHDERLASPLAVVYFEEFASLTELELQLNELTEQIQCVATETSVTVNIPQCRFGESQQPRLWDYADGINTLEFLSTL